MTTSLMLKNDALFNPLDIAEMVIMDRDWVFDRPAESELIAEVNGTCCSYKMWFNWQEEYSGMTMSCALDAKLPKKMLSKVYPLLALVNEKLWLGHFDVSSEDGSVTFRHAMMLRNSSGINEEHMKELMDLAISECERFYPAFQSVVWGGKTPTDALSLAMFETVGEA